MKRENYQGFMERGRVAEVTDEGYVVESLDRKGIVSPPLRTIAVSGHRKGDMVLFVLFGDGTGMIIAGM